MRLLLLFVLFVLGCCDEAELERDREVPLMVFSQVMILPSNDSRADPADQPAALETVLARAVRVASCEAGCLTEAQDECSHCRTVCRLLVSTPAWLNICSAPAICSPGCRAACQALDQKTDRKLSPGASRWDIKQFGCTLIWEIERDEKTEDLSIMFLVAAVDADQMFYHLATVTANNMVLDANIASKAETFIILAIGLEGILERHQVEVEQGSCQSSESAHSLLETEGKSSWILPNAVLATVTLLLVLAMLALGTIICNLQRRHEVSC